jgi:hypothetical protein
VTKVTLPAPARCVKALLAMMPPLPPPPSFSREGNAHSTNANSSPTALVHAICRVMKARTLSDWPLPADCVGGKDSKDDGGKDYGGASGIGRELDCTPDWDGPPLSSPSGGAMTTGVAGK